MERSFKARGVTTMNADVRCPQCGALFTVRREVLGKRTKCTRCGAAFTLVEPAAAPPPPPIAPAAPPAADYFPDMQPPPEISVAAPVASDPSPRPAGRWASSRELFGFEVDAGPPRFSALRPLARGYEILAVFVLIFAAFLFVMLVVGLIRNPDAWLAVIFGSGLTFFWATLVAMSLLVFAQAIRLALAIEQNTRSTQQACKQLADHLCAIETEP
jgi:hypothetical protein